MKRHFGSTLKWILPIFLALPVTTQAATEAEKLAAIQSGLAYLAGTQQASGAWDYGGYDPAATGAVVFAFLSQQGKWPPEQVVVYQNAVDKGISYLLAAAAVGQVSTRNDGQNICPGGAAVCDSVYWPAANNEVTYTTGLIAPAMALYGAKKGASAIATDAGALAGKTWLEIAQGITNFFAAAQSTGNQGNRQGGWRYAPPFIPGGQPYDSDMSTTQWAVISLLYDQTLGAVTPDITKQDLPLWLTVTQNAANGAGCYQPGSICDHSDTGGLLTSWAFLGKDATDGRVLKALNQFLNPNWTDGPSGTWYGNFGHPYAMWSVYKGLETTIGLDDNSYIHNLLTDCGATRPGGGEHRPGNPAGSKACNWWEDYNEYLVTTQQAGGSWPGYANWTNPLSTAFYLNILGATIIPAKQATTLTVSPGTQDYQDSVAVSATLIATATSAPVAEKPIDFVLGSGAAGETCSAKTDIGGVATCFVTPNEKAASVLLNASFAGDDKYLASTGSASFVITKEETATSLIGVPALIVNGTSISLSASLFEDGVVPISGRTLTLALGPQSCTATTNASGIGSCSIVVNQMATLGPATVTANFAGDDYYLLSSDSKSTLIFAFLASGSMVIGDRNAAVGTNVNFWGSQWWKNNSLSGGAAPAQFKGFANNAPHACSAVNWITNNGGNSVGPPASVPSYMGVIVSSRVVQTGSYTTGNVVKIVVVRTSPGYGPEPSLAGNGTVVAVFCP